MSEELEIRIKNSFIIGKQRTHTQDVEFAIEQLVEVAERSLSSGINDPFTAIACIDWLSAALAKLADKNFPSPFRYDHEGNLRIFFERPVTLVGAIDTAFNQIRQSATNNVAVRIRLLEQIAVLHGLIDDPEALEALERHAQIIERDHTGDRPAREDREDLRERYQDVGNNDQNVP